MSIVTSKLVGEFVKEFASGGVGSAISALRSSPKHAGRFFGLASLHRSVLTDVGGSALLGSTIAIAGVAHANRTRGAFFRRETIREMASEGAVEAISGAVSTAIAAAATVVSVKSVTALGIAGAKGTAITIGLPLASAALGAVVVRRLCEARSQPQSSSR